MCCLVFVVLCGLCDVCLAFVLFAVCLLFDCCLIVVTGSLCIVCCLWFE